MPMRVRVSGLNSWFKFFPLKITGLNSWLKFFSLKITGGAHPPPAGHTQLSRVNPTAGGRRQSLTDEWSGYCTRERADVVLGRVGGWVGGRACYVDTGRPLRHDFASFRDGHVRVPLLLLLLLLYKQGECVSVPSVPPHKL
jgi:hypothetical protein